MADRDRLPGAGDRSDGEDPAGERSASSRGDDRGRERAYRRSRADGGRPAELDGEVGSGDGASETATHGWGVADRDDDARPVLELDGVTKRYGPTTVVEDLSLSVREGELLTLVGPSGCGKTTTLRLIAGLERPDGGAIRIDGDVVADADRSAPPERRDVGIVFQEFALFPHMTAAENVAFGVEDLPREQRDARVAELLDLVGLSEHRDSHPDELSGGQQQRVALARSLAPEPQILLLDEPFSNLDVGLRERMREEVRAILKEAGVTAVSVTHDQEEALAISDRIAVVRDGRIEQSGRPERVFQHPESRFVADFLGHATFLPGDVRGDRVETGVGALALERVYGLTADYAESTVDLLVRPDDVSARPVPESESEADGRVVGRQYLGPTVMYRVELDDGTVVECMHNHTERIDPGTPVAVTVDADHDLAWFPRSVSPGDRTDGGGRADADTGDGGRTDDGAGDGDRVDGAGR